MEEHLRLLFNLVQNLRSTPLYVILYNSMYNKFIESSSKFNSREILEKNKIDGK